jgi:hypothetical protein
VQFQVDFGVPVVQVAAEAVEQLGEDRFDHAGPLFVQGVSSRAVMACQPGWRGDAVLPSRSRPVWRASLVTATYSSAAQSAVKLSSLAYPASKQGFPDPARQRRLRR